MLEEMRIADLGVIADALLEFGPGLSVVTGETGAGKTMVVSGLGLLMGARADSGLVRAGAERAVVEGRFRIEPTGPVAARVAEIGGDLDDDGTLLVSRTVGADGRSRAYVGGRAAPVGVLVELAPIWSLSTVSPTSCGCSSRPSSANCSMRTPVPPSSIRWRRTPTRTPAFVRYTQSSPT